ncbi:STAS domain-containing protein [Aneurinibacillus tyrosinisolvens]|uniref:STAS domain-containing protein n=1 Tax=Aneurinibacillus tyrosinisolvens TaxID=1443435 RepID=UPI00063FC260|nr:STAS domain-containing protein [Aneurinibacillus tyrosinisolvens]
MSLISKVANYLIEDAKPLAVEIVEGVLQRMNLEIPEWEKKQAVIMYIEFIEFLGKSITSDEEGVPEDLIAWSKKNGEREASLGGRISDIIVRYPPTRIVFTERMTEIGLEHGLSTKEVTFINKRINCMLDTSINETIFAFERLKDKIIKETQKEMAELSAPVVPIQDGIAVLPLIGSIDSYRANYILEKVVPKVAELEIECLIIDFSGIQMIDTAVTNHLFKIHNVLRLLGIKAIATGLRPEIAQTVISGGIDFSSIKTYANVKQAIESME